jgi:hypothetical protein
LLFKAIPRWKLHNQSRVRQPRGRFFALYPL